MSTIDEIFATISDEDVSANVDELLVIDQTTRQISLPSNELIFGVESDGRAERKYFQCPRMVGNDLDITSCFIRINYRNANGEIDSHLVEDVTVKGDMVLFSWELHEKVTKYMGNVQFLVCATRADKVEWHTTIATGLVLEGLEPEVDGIVEETGDLVAQLISMVEAQITAVESEGEKQVSAVKSEGATQIAAVKASAEATEAEILNEIQAKGTNTLASIPNDYTALGEAVGALERMAAPGIVCEAEGTSIVVDDASNSPVQNLRIFGRSTQDGTPTPDNPVEIQSVENPSVTVCGKNLYDKDTYPLTQGNWVNSDGGISGGVEFAATLSYIPVKHLVGKQLTLNKRPGGGNPSIAFYNMNQQLVVSYKNDSGSGGTPRTFTVPENAEYMRFCTISGDDKIQIEIGSNATEYEPYSGQTVELTHTLPGIPVASGGNYTDGNGQQWICDEVDFERGVYVQRVKSKVINGSLAPTIFVDGTYGGSILGWAYEAIGMDSIDRSRVRKMCDRLSWSENDSPTSYKDCPIGCWTFNSNGSADNFLLMNLGYFSTNNEAVNWLVENPVTFHYALATPIETPLTEAELASFKALHTNKPHTTVLNDQSAHIELSYVADTKLYIDRKIEAILG